jgi:hypothetical protein
MDDRTDVRRIEFVPVGEAPKPGPRRRSAKAPEARPEAASAPAPAVAPPEAEQRWSLWGDLEP